MATTDDTFDDRDNIKTPTGKRNVSCQSGSNVTTVSSAKFGLNGHVKAFKHEAPNLTTDSDFNFTVEDQDGVTIYTQNSIADNGNTYTNLSYDNILLLCGGQTGNYIFKWTWTTAQNITAGAFKTVVYYW